VTVGADTVGQFPTFVLVVTSRTEVPVSDANPVPDGNVNLI
jgi:hypothetical protein